MIGARSGETYRLGDAVTVRLVEAAPVAGALRFELLSEGRHNVAGRRPMRREHSTRAPSGNRPRRARMGRQ
jgi:ribonuclease R